jgi:hypothetical protein
MLAVCQIEVKVYVRVSMVKVLPCHHDAVEQALSLHQKSERLSGAAP